MISISISGTHSVGKTTLALQLKEIFPQATFIPEVARTLLDRRFLLNKDITEWGIVNYVYNYLRLERNLKSSFIVSDRSLIDLLAYLTTNQSPKIRPTYISLVEEIVFMESKRFSHYFYIPVEFPLVLDEVRPSDYNYQLAVDLTLKNLFSIFNIVPHVISGTFEERKQKAIQIINGDHK